MAGDARLARAYVLSRRDYRDTSLIVDFLTDQAGRVGAVARGARGRRGSALQPFCPLLVALTGRGELKTVGNVEADGYRPVPTGAALYSGFYLNELLQRTLQREDALPGLFALYEETLGALHGAQGEALEVALRRFEFRYLEQLGYGVDPAHASDTGAPLTGHEAWVVPLAGVHDRRPEGPSIPAPVAVLEAIARLDFAEAEVRLFAKRIARAEVDALLGGRPLKARELFAPPARPR